MARIRILFARLIGWLLFHRPVEVNAGAHRLIFDPRSGSLFPVIQGADDDDGDDDADDDDEDSDDEDDSDDDEDEDSDDDDSDDDEDDDKESDKPGFLRRIARRNERRAKRHKKRADRLEAEVARLKKGKGGKGDDEDGDGESEELRQAKSELEEERRSFRLEQGVSRIARKGVEVGEGKKAKAVKFKDPDDALVNIERKLRKGELDADELFNDDGRVNASALEEALADLADEKPHLLAERERKRGSGDAGKGKPSGKDASEKSPADFDKDIREDKR